MLVTNTSHNASVIIWGLSHKTGGRLRHVKRSDENVLKITVLLWIGMLQP